MADAGWTEALLTHWPEYLAESCLLGLFMMSACAAVSAVEHPASPLARRLPPWRRRALIGLLMGLTAIALIDSPLGQRSGAHMNPATTLTYLALGTIRPWDALFYIVAQFAGAVAGVGASGAILRGAIRHARVNYAATRPGPRGAGAAWAAEFVIAFGLMETVLLSSNSAAAAPYTGLLAGLLVAVYITVEAPLSGMSMNPARTLGSALHARSYESLWVYFTAPPLGMLAAAALYTAIAGAHHVYCAKLDHRADGPCIFDCRIHDLPGRKR